MRLVMDLSLLSTTSSSVMNELTRVTSTSVTSSDHIRSHNFLNDDAGGVIYTIIPDPLPVFAAFKMDLDSGSDRAVTNREM